MKFFLLNILVILFFINSPAISTQAELIDSARAMLEERDKQIKDIIGDRTSDFPDELRNELQGIINDVIDYRAMAQHALLDTWDELSPEQRDEFVDIFSTIIRDQSLNTLDIYRANVTYDEFTVVDDNRVIARTIATLDNVRTPVIYDMVKEDGTWIVIDMSVDNFSTADSYQRSFQNIIRRRGYDALLNNLKRRSGVS